MKHQLLWLMLVLAGAVVLYSWLETTDDGPKPVIERELKPDFVAYQLTRRSFDQQGNLSGQVKASQMSHFEQLGQIQFEQPDYTLYDERLPRWQVSSRQGVFYQDNKVILEQNVVVNNLHADEMFRQIQTEQLSMSLDTQLLQTELPVRILGQSFQINGQGLQADLTTQKLRLFKHQGTVYQHENQ
jgi:lipopolysaccharide export system protein LptC